MNEAQTKHDFITQALQEAGWGIVEGSRLRLEFPITKGRLIGRSKRAKPIYADYILEYKKHFKTLNIIEERSLFKLNEKGGVPILNCKNYRHF